VRIPTQLLTRKLMSIGGVSLTPENAKALSSLEGKLIELPADHDVVREHERPTFITLLLDGFLCRYKIVADGKRQILSFHIPGDIPDLQSLHLTASDHNLCAFARSRLAVISHASMHLFLAEHPTLASLFWRDTLIDAAIFREWMTSIGRRPSFARIAHLMCELIVRMRAVGLAEDHRVKLPLTQTDIGDALGISTVHVNRTLQELRHKGLIRYDKGELIALDWERLKDAGEFDQSYLHLRGMAELDNL
jgi:CRP-like cAMP-binding protein